MLLALEANYDTVGWIHEGRYRAEVFSEQEVQPMFTMKDSWDLCTCEGGDTLVEPYGQYDPTAMEPYREYVWCPLGNPSQGPVPQYRYDWRPGRELTEEQATRWALAHNASDAHYMFNGPRKEATASVDLPQARGVIPTYVEVDGVPISGVGEIRVDYIEGDGFADVGTLRVSDGREFMSVPVAGYAMEGDREFAESVVRATVERFEHWRAERERSRRESGGADSGGPSAEGAAE